MQYIVAFFLCALLCVSAPVSLASHGDGNDNSLQASYTANCNASFQVDCPNEPTELIASDSQAAPIGGLGNSAVEFALLVVATAAFALRRKRSQPSRRRPAVRKIGGTH